MQDQRSEIEKILVEARTRWLKPLEVVDILKNYEAYEFQLNQNPPDRPGSGSLYLFDRKVVRFFRKDNHNWRKKKDNKTVREAHEKLKAGSEDVLHCYYAHSEDDDRFQRRCYWLLDEAMDNIVLVHYREVEKGSGRVNPSPRSSAPSSPTYLSTLGDQKPDFLLPGSPKLQPVQQLAESFSGSGEHSGFPAGDFLDIDSLPKKVHQAFTEPLPELQVDFFPEQEIPETSWMAGNSQLQSMQQTSQIKPAFETEDKNRSVDLPLWARNSSATNFPAETGDYFWQNNADNGFGSKPSSMDFPTASMWSNRELSLQGFGNAGMGEPASNDDLNGEPLEPGIPKLPSVDNMMSDSIGRDRIFSLGRMENDSLGYSAMEKTDSVGKWMNEMDDENKDGMDKQILGPAEQKSADDSASVIQFVVADFAPNIGPSSGGTKILIVGESNSLPTQKWGCLFGSQEVSAEFIAPGVLKCLSPPGPPGKVKFALTAGDSEPCSELFEFQYTSSEPAEKAEFKRMQIKLVHHLLESKHPAALLFAEDLQMMEKAYREPFSNEVHFETLFNLLLKRQMVDFTSSPNNGVQSGSMGVLHLVAALGYGWAVPMLKEFGVDVNGKDSNGCTPLHWAATCGRMASVQALLEAGANPMELAVLERTGSEVGASAAQMASQSGHLEIAQYLSQMSLSPDRERRERDSAQGIAKKQFVSSFYK